MKQFIWITSRFIGFHRWKDAPDDVAFLRDYHRHVFHVKVTMSVSHADRQLEFFQQQRKLMDFLLHYENQRFDKSCEMIATEILLAFNAHSVEVSEDGENGAIVEALTSQRLRTRCFMGIEVEGPYRGAVSLFVPGSCTPDRLVAVVERAMATEALSRIYYGAGNDRNLRRDTMLAVIKTAQMMHLQVDVETTEIDGVTELARESGASIILLTHNDNTVLPPQAHFLKRVTDGLIVWTDREGKTYTATTDDSLFDRDQFVE